MKYSVSSYSYSRLVSSGKYTEKQLVPLAKKMGFDGIEFAEIHSPKDKNKAEYAAEVCEEAKKCGIELVTYCIGANLIENLDAEIERLKKEVDIAAVLGVKVMRHDAAWGYGGEEKHTKGFSDALPDIIRGCKAVTEYAKTKGIKTCIENHGTFVQDSERVAAVVNGVGSENFGALVDIGNFMCADENPAEAVGNVANYAVHVHAKDFHFKKGTEFVPEDGFFMTRGGNFLRGAIIGHGAVPVVQCLRIIKNSGYNGYVTVEFEGMEDPITGISSGLNSLKRIEKLI